MILELGLELDGARTEVVVVVKLGGVVGAEEAVGLGSAVTVSVAKTVTVKNFAGSEEVGVGTERVEVAREEDADWEVVDAGTSAAASGGAVTPGGVDAVLRSSEVVCSFARGLIMIAVLS